MINGMFFTVGCGTVLRDLELLPAGNTKKCVVTIGWNTPKKVDGGYVENWHQIDVTVLGKRAEWAASTLSNGSFVAIEARVETTEFDGRYGKSRKTECVALQIQSLDRGIVDTSGNTIQDGTHQRSAPSTRQNPQTGYNGPRSRQAPPTRRDESEAYGYEYDEGNEYGRPVR